MDATIIYKIIKDKITKVKYNTQITKEDKDDLIQELFIRIYEKFLENKIDIDNIENYIFISCRNIVYKHLYDIKIKKDIERPIDTDYNLPYETNQDSFSNETIDRLKKYVYKNIPMQMDKEVFEMRFEGYRIKEIAKHFNTTVKRIELILRVNKKYINNSLNNKKFDSKSRRYIYQLVNQNNETINFTKKIDLAKYLNIGLTKVNRAIREGNYENLKIKYFPSTEKLKRK
jgi:RNA polymerase sigma factor (sigma-70 family)